MQADTITAIATAPGLGAISIVKISGPAALKNAEAIFLPHRNAVKLSKLPSHRLVVGDIVDRGRVIDEVLVSVMLSPGSYTGEDVVEINCHGGHIAARTVVELLLQQGCRLAEAGEFTRRAFLNGRLSLSQAESVIDVINARSRQGLEMAIATLRGKGQDQLEIIEDKVIMLSALIEASIDFPEEVGDLDREQALTMVDEAIAAIHKLLVWAERGRVYREGLKVVISGKPNVGKSSLLNLLLNENRVIVSDIPGTTRDTIEDNIEIQGLPVRIIDTAGIRSASDQIEEMGIARSQEAIQNADVVIMVMDMSAGLTTEDETILALVKQYQKKTIFLINKIDLPEHRFTDPWLGLLAQEGQVILASVKEDRGISELVDAVFSLGVGEVSREPEMLTNLRQKVALELALRSLNEVRMGIKQQLTLDCLAVDVMLARDHLGEVTGRNIKEEIVDRIFSEFCIGK